jgi:hypothetical protein
MVPEPMGHRHWARPRPPARDAVSRRVIAAHLSRRVIAARLSRRCIAALHRGAASRRVYRGASSRRVFSTLYRGAFIAARLSRRVIAARLSRRCIVARYRGALSRRTLHSIPSCAGIPEYKTGSAGRRQLVAVPGGSNRWQCPERRQ